MLKTQSSAQRRAAAISRRYPAWSLTDGMSSTALHISAAFRAIRKAGEYRRECAAGRMSKADCWKLAVNDLSRAGFNLSIGRRNSRLPA